jgi:hypothetical protein
MVETATKLLKNKRLSLSNRQVLFDLASKQVRATADTAIVDAAYDAAADAIHAVLVGKFPQKDMKVLARYDCAQEDACIYISSGGYRNDRFEFRDGDKRIVFRPGTSCNQRSPHLLDGEAQLAFDAFQLATKARDAEIKARLSDYKALIYGANTFNEVVAVWPAADALRDSIIGSGTALMVLSGDVIDRLKVDAASEWLAA